ncbi:MAG: hypothetical protein U1F43_04835 [Myxococcota bacterium]
MIPDLALLDQVKAERDHVKQMKADVQKDIDASMKIKEQAIGADQTLTKYAAGLDKQAAEIGVEKASAAKDVTEVTKAKADITKGGADVAANKSKAESEKSKTEAKASEGKAVANPQVDTAKKKQEEDKKAAQEKAAWDREYASSSWLGKRWMDAKKLVGGVFSWIAKAAAWVWNNIIKVAIEAVKAAVAKVIGFITDLMMKGIMSIVKCFLSQEEGARLDSTMAEMKALEAKQAQKATEEGGEKNKEAKMKLTGAQAQAKARIDHAQGNITTGQGLLTQLDGNDQALAKEEADIQAKNDAFKAQYAPYFDWAAEQEKKGAGGGDQKDQKGGGAADKAPDKGADAGGGAKGGGAEDKGPAGGKTPPANEGKKADEPKKEHPADAKMEPALAVGLQMAINVVIMESKESMKVIAEVSAGQQGKVGKVADAVLQANIEDLKSAATKMQAMGKSGDPSSFLSDEQMRNQAVKKAATNVDSQVVASHAKGETDRQSRLQQMMAQANALTSQSLVEALKTAEGIGQQLGKEAAAIDTARKEAMDELAKGYSKTMGG